MAKRHQSLADSYVNGNRKDVRDELAKLPPLEAIALAFDIAEDLRGSRGVTEWRAFRASVAHWGEP